MRTCVLLFLVFFPPIYWLPWWMQCLCNQQLTGINCVSIQMHGVFWYVVLDRTLPKIKLKWIWFVFLFQLIFFSLFQGRNSELQRFERLLSFITDEGLNSEDWLFEESSLLSLHRVTANSTEQKCISSHSEGHLFLMEGAETLFYFRDESLESGELLL